MTSALGVSETIWGWYRSPYGVTVQRSSDGRWHRNGELMPWLCARTVPHPKLVGITVMAGRYSLTFARLRDRR